MNQNKKDVSVILFSCKSLRGASCLFGCWDRWAVLLLSLPPPPSFLHSLPSHQPPVPLKRQAAFLFFFHLLLQLWGSQTIAVSPPKSSLIKRRFPLHSVCPSLPHYQHLANLALSCQGPSDSCNELHSENVIFVPPFHTMEASSTRLSQPEWCTG